MKTLILSAVIIGSQGGLEKDVQAVGFSDYSSEIRVNHERYQASPGQPIIMSKERFGKCEKPYRDTSGVMILDCSDSFYAVR